MCCAVAQVFDDKATFAEWFSDALGKQGAGGGGGPDEWLETEKRVVVIHRLHQILEPFMLRRQVQDVEGKLPPKVCTTHPLLSHMLRTLCLLRYALGPCDRVLQLVEAHVSTCMTTTVTCIASLVAEGY